MAPQFTESVAQVLNQAVSDAEKRRHTEVTEHHVLYAFFQDRAGYFQTLTTALGLDPHPLLLALENKLASLPTFSGQADQASLSRGLQSQINHAHVLSQKCKDSYISSDHFFYI
ncbi:MAG: type VI secretion system ATPase TssH, partial [Simkania sp.]|nr:type VI secretion system ATPase TssH [Simkania sp.]